MAIEFNKMIRGGESYVCAMDGHNVKAEINSDGLGIKTYGKLTKSQMEQILSKMKELQGENNGY